MAQLAAQAPASSAPGGLTQSVNAVFGGAIELLWQRPRQILQATAIGTLIGILPGAGADIAAWVSYGVSKRSSPKPEDYGRGSIEGIADAGAANNSALAGAWVPALTLGIPGDSITAIVLGIMMMKNLQPGPEIFDRQAVLVYSLYLVFVLANLALLPAGFLAVRASGMLIRVPRHTLLPVIVLFCVLGSYAIAGSYFDVGIMLAMGVLGFLLERWDVPVGPIVLGIILGGPLEERFVQAMTASQGSLTVFFARPLAAALGWLPLLSGCSRPSAPGDPAGDRFSLESEALEPVGRPLQPATWTCVGSDAGSQASTTSVPLRGAVTIVREAPIRSARSCMLVIPNPAVGRSARYLVHRPPPTTERQAIAVSTPGW